MGRWVSKYARRSALAARLHDQRPTARSKASWVIRSERQGSSFEYRSSLGTSGSCAPEGSLISGATERDLEAWAMLRRSSSPTRLALPAEVGVDTELDEDEDAEDNASAEKTPALSSLCTALIVI